MKRREFITLLAGVGATWPLAARAQQPAMPVIGVLHTQSLDGAMEFMRGFRQGLKEAGFADGENVAIEYRWADNQLDRLPALAAELVRRRVAVIVAFSISPVFAAKAATTTLPIVFTVGEDPVNLGIVASLARPGGNLTGVNFLVGEVTAKRLDLLRELAPTATRIAVLVNPADSTNAATTLKDVEPAARARGMQIQVLRASTSGEINAAFVAIGRERPDALFVSAGPFFQTRRIQLAQLAAFHRLPAMYPVRQNAEAGGLMSYGTNLTDGFRQAGVYAGRILKGAKPEHLPVVQASKFELVINAETARMLGITVPPSLLAIADEVIE